MFGSSASEIFNRGNFLLKMTQYASVVDHWYDNNMTRPSVHPHACFFANSLKEYEIITFI